MLTRMRVLLSMRALLDERATFVPRERVNTCRQKWGTEKCEKLNMERATKDAMLTM